MLHLIGLSDADATLPEVGSIRLLRLDGVALIVQEIPPDFGMEAAAALTEALLSEAWGTLCRLSETRSVLAFRFGQTVEDEDAARRVANAMRGSELIADENVFGGEEWTLVFSTKAPLEPVRASYLAAKSSERRKKHGLAERAMGVLETVEELRDISPAVTESGGVSFQVLAPRSLRDDVLYGIATATDEANLEVRAVGPQPIFHFAPAPEVDDDDA